MASTKLGSVAEGSIVKLKENGVLVDFYVAKQDYEPELNSPGRVLVVRKECYDERAWHSSNVNAYAISDIDKWLNAEYKNMLNADVRTAMDTTKIHHTPGNNSIGTTTLERAVFLLSATELGQSDAYKLAKEGTALSSMVLSLLKKASIKGSACGQWTRSPCWSSTETAWGLNLNGNSYTGYCSSVRTGARPAFTLPSNLYINDDGSVSYNTTPAVPASITIPSSINGGTSITVSWGAATDAEDNLSGYIVERSTDGGSSWSQIYKGSALSTSNTVTFGTASVMYRVKAYDSEGLESDWKTSNKVTVINNRAPGAPPSITVPTAVNGGASLTITWAKATDSDGNLSGYELERSVGGGAWSRVYRGTALAYTDTITKGWATVAYRVRAYDTYSAYSGYTASAARTVNNNTAPTITGSSANGANLGVKAEGFDLTYQVADAEGDAVTVTESLDGVTQRTFQAALGTSNTFQAVAAANWRTVLNGAHTLKVTASDGKASGTYSVAFEKKVTSASVTLAEPMEADDQITVCAISVTGNIPADAAFKVEVCNNAKDAAPAWEDCTAAVRSGANHVFANKTAARGFAFSFRVSVSRGSSGQGGYITSIQGGFQ